jgi:flagellar capping protein FliD
MLVEKMDTIIDSQDGYLSQSQTGLKNRITEMDIRISDLNDKMSAYREQLVKQFAALETTLSELKSQGTTITNAVTAWTSS